MKNVPSLKGLLNRTNGLIPSNRPSVDDAAHASVSARRDEGAPPRGTTPKVGRPDWLKRLAFRRATVAASVEGSSLRIVSFVNQDVVGWTSINLDSGIVRNGQIVDPANLGDVVDEAFDRLKLSRGRVIWALPGFQTMARVLDLPDVRGAALREAVYEEAEQALGVDVDDSYLFWQRLEGRVRSRKVFVLALPKTTVLTALEALEAAEIHPTTMDLRPLALARAVGRGDAIVVNLEDGTLDIAIVARGIPTLIRGMPLPGVSSNVEAAQNRLIDEVDRALTYYDDSDPLHRLDPDAPLYLTGRLATGIALTEKIRTVTHHPIGRLPTNPSYPPDFPVAEYLVQLGLALKRS